MLGLTKGSKARASKRQPAGPVAKAKVTAGSKARASKRKARAVPVVVEKPSAHDLAGAKKRAAKRAKRTKA